MSDSKTKEELVESLKRSVGSWNAWRKEHPFVRPNLSWASLVEAGIDGADLSEADLREADLSGARLVGAILSDAILSKANLSGADLSRANLNGANLGGAHLLRADLCEADLGKADLHDARVSGAHLLRADLREANLRGAKLTGTNLREAVLSKANLAGTDLSGADLSGANLDGVILSDADLREANFRGAKLIGANLSGATPIKADFRGARLIGAKLSGADLSEADFRGARLIGADLSDAELRHANLSGADLSMATLLRTDLEKANLTDCLVYGILAWDLRLEGATQDGLIIAAGGRPRITIGDLEVAQFIHLLLYDPKIRKVIDTMTSKVVLILGQFTDDRKTVLDAMRRALGQRGLVPIIFDFESPASTDLTGTVGTLARMSRFIIADITVPDSIPEELTAVIPDVSSVPVQTLILATEREYTVYERWRKHPWVLPVFPYDNVRHLLASLDEKVIRPAVEKAGHS